MDFITQTTDLLIDFFVVWALWSDFYIQSKSILQLCVGFHSWIYVTYFLSLAFFHPMLCLMWHSSIQEYFSIICWILLFDFIFSRHAMSYVTFVNPRLFFNSLLNFTLGFHPWISFFHLLYMCFVLITKIVSHHHSHFSIVC